MLCPFTLHVIPLPISNTMVMSFPLISSSTSPGTTAEPFISTVTVLPSCVRFTSSRITSQPSLPFSPLIKGASVVSPVSVTGLLPGLLPFPIPGAGSVPWAGIPGVTVGLTVPGLIYPFPASVLSSALPPSTVLPPELSPPPEDFFCTVRVPFCVV